MKMIAETYRSPTICLKNIFRIKLWHCWLKKQTNTLCTKTGKILILMKLKSYIHVKMGTLHFSRVSMCWFSKHGTGIPAIADAMPVNRFFRLCSHFHVVDTNKKPENDDRL